MSRVVYASGYPQNNLLTSQETTSKGIKGRPRERKIPTYPVLLENSQGIRGSELGPRRLPLSETFVITLDIHPKPRRLSQKHFRSQDFYHCTRRLIVTQTLSLSKSLVTTLHETSTIIRDVYDYSKRILKSETFVTVRRLKFRDVCYYSEYLSLSETLPITRNVYHYRSALSETFLTYQ